MFTLLAIYLTGLVVSAAHLLSWDIDTQENKPVLAVMMAFVWPWTTFKLAKKLYDEHFKGTY